MGDREWTQTVQEFYQPIYRYALQILGSSADAEDATQKTFLKAYQSRDTLREGSAKKAWLYTIARNVCFDRRRSWKRLFLSNSVQENVATRPESNELMLTLKSLILQLPLKQREVFVLRHWHDFSTRETAELLGIGEGTVKSHLKRAIQALQQQLKEEGIFSSADAFEKNLSSMTTELAPGSSQLTEQGERL